MLTICSANGNDGNAWEALPEEVDFRIKGIQIDL